MVIVVRESEERDALLLEKAEANLISALMNNPATHHIGDDDTEY